MGIEVGVWVIWSVGLTAVLVGLGVGLGTGEPVGIWIVGVSLDEIVVGLNAISLPTGFSSIPESEEVWQPTAKEMSKTSNQLRFTRNALLKRMAHSPSAARISPNT